MFRTQCGKVDAYTTSSKKSPRKSHTDTPASFTVLNTVRKTAAVSVSSPSPSSLP